jgi:zinc protease
MPSTLGTGLAPVRTVLDNGAVVVAKETRTTPAVTINLAVRAGSVCDPADAPGAMHLLSRVIDRGTATRSADAVAEELDSRGIALNVTVTRHLFSIVCTCLADDFVPVLALLGDILTAPSVPESELATRKVEVVTGIRQDDDNPGVRAVEALMSLLYPDGHPYGRRLKGTAAVVDEITRERLVKLHADRFSPGELSVVVVGDVPPDQVRDAAEQVFGRWRNPDPPAVPIAHPAPAVSRQRLVIPMMNKAQADVAYGFVAVARTDPNYEAFRLMNNAFGQYAIGGRLGDSIRERQGMAYYVFSALDANVVEGPLVIRAGVSPENVDRTIASIDAEIARLVSEGLTGQELNESRQYLVGSLPRTLETNAGIANFLQAAEFFGLGLDYDVRLPDLVAAVTADEVRAAAARVLDPSRATVVVAGPYGGIG